jgi:2-amino-4-hydroxy-6-hydroxymethyldihydropteridine diphosphokinase
VSIPEKGTWVPAYIGIGSNLDDPLARVQSAFKALERVDRTQVVLVSRIYRTAPLGSVSQPDFYNAAAGVLTQLAPLDLLRALKALETELGREQPLVRWGPRKIDFDVLMYGAMSLQSEVLVLPHPGLLERAFALVPLADIAPDVRVPGSVTVGELARRCNRAGLECVPRASATP